MRVRKLVLPVIAATLGFLLPAQPARAEEGGAGHYAPGAMATFIDAFPGEPGALGVLVPYTNYDGSAETTREVPVAGLITFGLEAEANTVVLAAFYQTKLQVLGGYYALGAAVPYIWMDAEATVSGPLGDLVVSDDASGIGDVTFYPLMLGWVGAGGDLKHDIRLGVYAPTGDFEKGKLANLGKNYWTFEPGFFVTYLSSKNGRQATAYVAFDFNTKNTDTDYQSGSVFHADATLGQHFPLFGGAAGIAANGFYYQQISGDGGSGATLLGEFKGRTIGVGPVLSYFAKAGETPIAVEVKWLPELDVEKRLEGDFIWAKLALRF